jgi:cytochrome c biogenesis protein CcdA
MKYIKTLFFTIFLLSIITQLEVVKADNNTVYYFKESTCLVCQSLEGKDGGVNYIERIENLGITIITIDILDTQNTITTFLDHVSIANEDFTNADSYDAFLKAYEVQSSESSVPIMFVGDTYYTSDMIKNKVDNQDILSDVVDPFKEVIIYSGSTYENISSFLGYLTVLGAGLLDGFNPCAIALLLLFVSLLGFSNNKKVLLAVSFTYIFALFISYLLIGVLLFNLLTYLTQYQDTFELINFLISVIVFIVALVLIVLNLLDYRASKNKKYGDIRNQLPKWIQKMNKRILSVYKGVVDGTNNTALWVVMVVTFLLGITLSITEFVCTGQIYLGVLTGIHTSDDIYPYFALISYNIMFIIPLVLIAFFSIKGKGVMATSNWIREHMSTIKLLNATFFILIAIYFLTRIIPYISEHLF